jgi:hypothetical protein
MNRRNISSSVMSGAEIASTPRLKRSTFSFLGGERRGGVGSNLKMEGASVDIQLQETNRILVEIQKQLSLDFANRIVEKRQAIRASKTKLYAERAGAKEKAVESVRSFGSGILKTFDVIAAPAKSIFQKILDFFSIIVSGLLINNAFRWLENPANRQKIDKFFKFVAKHWKELLALYGAYKVLKIVGALKRIADLFKRPPRWPRGGGGGGGPQKPGPKGPQPNDPCAGVLKCGGSILKVIKDNASAIALILASFLGEYFLPKGKPTLAKPTGLKPGELDTAKGTSRSAVNAALMSARPDLFGPDAGMTPEEKLFDKMNLPRWLAPVVESLVSAAMMRRGMMRTSFLRGNPNQYPGGIGPFQPPTNRTRPTKKGNTRLSSFSIRDILGRASQPGGFEITNIQGKSLGGTVGGTGSGTVDSVPAMLAPGEEVIRASAAMLFRPLLKDINNNAGRMWNTFTSAVSNLITSNSDMRSSLTILASQLSDFKKQLDQFVNDEKIKKTKNIKNGSIENHRTSRPVSPELVLHSDIKNPPKRSAKSAFIPINLPTQSLPPSGIPKYDSAGETMTEAPEISSINIANPYMKIVPEMLGIFV